MPLIFVNYLLKVNTLLGAWDEDVKDTESRQKR